MENLKSKGQTGEIPVFCAFDEIIKIDEVKPNPKNPNTHPTKQIKLLAKIIENQGWRAPITVSTLSGYIVRGHGRLEAAKILGLDSVPVDYQSYRNNDEEIADLLADNRLAELAEMDNKLLAEIFADFDPDALDVELTGYTEDEYESLMNALNDSLSKPDEDDAPEPPKEAKAKVGDIYQLGRHRLMCGDSTSIDAVEKLMDGQKVDLFLTDPPYNVALGMGGSVDEARKRHRRTDGLVIMNDKMENDEFREFLTTVFSNAKIVMKAGAAYYIWHADNEGYNFRGAIQDAGFQLRQTLIWKKQSITLGRQDYQWIHEPCLYGWNEGSSHAWYSDRKQGTVLCFDRPTKSELHPTMKPVALFDYQIKNSSKPGDIVLDLFGGSGTTMMACEQNGRTAYLMELDPRYVDVIVERWENMTGEKAVLVRE